jgi:hypothetical protein
MVKVQYGSVMLGQIIPTQVHQTLTVEVKVVARQQYLSIVKPWQELEILSVAVMPVPLEVRM